MGKTMKETPTERLAKQVISSAPTEPKRRERPDHVGLRGLRSVTRGALLPPCENCKCRRYSPCLCMKKAVD